ncbi:YiiD C-terminal domain-containing protein [Dokdonella ginsengisoli]|uniref:YiiD C-terminal domain-containing protein n=1 Tax=Dokdonella ginsengisoli TaxID=363846 RepID=A0ABV9QPP1_9GAMM
MIDLAHAAHAVHAAALEHELLADIPLARAMALRADAYDGASLTLAAPLAPNVNDKGCAFGGSLASLMTLSGWGLIKLAVDARALACDIYVQDSSVRYLAPVWQDFAAVARLAEGEAFEEFFATLAARGKGRLRVHCTVPLADGSPAATLDARFVALAKR